MRSILIIFVLSVFYLTGCKYQRLLKSTDFNLKYDMAVKYYEKEDYGRAFPLWEELLNVYKGTAKAPDVYYYYAKCNFGMGDYALASYHFKNYTTTFPSSPRTEECAYMAAFCYFKDSPSFKLDPTSTEQALGELQLFINRYPESPKVNECNELMDKLRQKLETKDYETAKLFYKMENYKASIIAFSNIAKDFPESLRRQECVFLALKSRYLLAINSIEEKKNERFELTKKSYLEFIDLFPNSTYMAEAEKMYETTIKELEKIKNKNKPS